MLRRSLALYFALIIVCSLAGCSSGVPSSSGSAGVSASSEQTSAGLASLSSSNSPLFSDVVWPSDEYAIQQLPAPSFSVPLESISISRHTVGGIWKGVPDSEVADYVTVLKEAGFVVDPTESKSSNRYFFSADNSEDLDATNVMLTYTAADADGPSSLSIIVSRLD